MTSPIRFFSSVGGGIFGGVQTASWRDLGIEVAEVSAIDVASYWRSKGGWRSRLGMRWRSLVSFPRVARQAVAASEPGTVCVAVTNPFFLPATLAREGTRRNRRVIHLVFDLYPDALVIGGGWARWNLLCQWAARTTRIAIREAAATVYLGERLRRHAELTYGRALRTEVIPVGTDASLFRAAPPQRRESREVRFLYSGHFGRLHDWQTLANGIPRIVETVPAARLEFAADGPGMRRLKNVLAQQMEGDTAVTFGGTRGSDAWREAMLAADVALVTMIPGAERVVMPSKTYSAMAAGQAVLAICSPNSDLADLVSQHDAGWVVEPGDVAGLVDVLRSIVEAPEILLQKRRNAWSAAHAHYSMEVLGKRWLALFESLEPTGRIPQPGNPVKNS